MTQGLDPLTLNLNAQGHLDLSLKQGASANFTAYSGTWSLAGATITMTLRLPTSNNTILATLTNGDGIGIEGFVVGGALAGQPQAGVNNGFRVTFDPTETLAWDFVAARYDVFAELGGERVLLLEGALDLRPAVTRD